MDQTGRQATYHRDNESTSSEMEQDLSMEVPKHLDRCAVKVSGGDFGKEVLEKYVACINLPASGRLILPYLNINKLCFFLLINAKK